MATFFNIIHIAIKTVAHHNSFQILKLNAQKSGLQHLLWFNGLGVLRGKTLNMEVRA